jgi:O-antigen/teichoic acid export membrane protein
MASRMVLQLRALLVSANQVLVPAIADLKEKNPEIIQHVYRQSYRLNLYLSLPYFSAIIGLSPVISRFWIGHYEGIFVFASILLATGWLINALATPAYFANMGIGDLRWNTLAHITIGALNLVMGILLGSIFGGGAVIISRACSQIAGSLMIPIAYHHKHKISLSELLPRENIGVGLASMLGLSASLFLYQFLGSRVGLLGMASSIVLVFLAIVVFPLWLHPLRKRFVVLFVEELLRMQK